MGRGLRWRSSVGVGRNCLVCWFVVMVDGLVLSFYGSPYYVLCLLIYIYISSVYFDAVFFGGHAIPVTCLAYLAPRGVCTPSMFPLGGTGVCSGSVRWSCLYTIDELDNTGGSHRVTESWVYFDSIGCDTIIEGMLPELWLYPLLMSTYSLVFRLGVNWCM